VLSKNIDAKDSIKKGLKVKEILFTFLGLTKPEIGVLGLASNMKLTSNALV
jgi:hypothetical protein